MSSQKQLANGLNLPGLDLIKSTPHLAQKLAECQDVKDCEVCVARVDHILVDPCQQPWRFNAKNNDSIKHRCDPISRKRRLRRTTKTNFAKKLHKSACPNQSYGRVGCMGENCSSTHELNGSWILQQVMDIQSDGKKCKVNTWGCSFTENLVN